MLCVEIQNYITKTFGLMIIFIVPFYLSTKYWFWPLGTTHGTIPVSSTQATRCASLPCAALDGGRRVETPLPWHDVADFEIMCFACWTFGWYWVRDATQPAVRDDIHSTFDSRFPNYQMILVVDVLFVWHAFAKHQLGFASFRGWNHIHIHIHIHIIIIIIIIICCFCVVAVHRFFYGCFIVTGMSCVSPCVDFPEVWWWRRAQEPPAWNRRQEAE